MKLPIEVWVRRPCPYFACVDGFDGARPCPTCHGEQFITEWVSLADLLKELAEHA
jgi:hypothetical protein